MARVIPTILDDDDPDGEREVFQKLRNGPADWVAIHGLNLRPWRHGKRTELDFAILIPDIGILCVEVKSHRQISIHNGAWYSSGKSLRDPFRQALNASKTLQRRLKEKRPSLVDMPVMHCCLFTHAPFTIPQNLSIAPWELMDAVEFRALSTGDALCASLKERMLKGMAIESKPSFPLTHEQIHDLEQFCYPVQTRKPDKRDEILHRKRELESYLLDQQKPPLHLAMANDRVVIDGAAGTGKTLIAVELARRIAEEGRHVGLLCFNRLVGKWLHQQVTESSVVFPGLMAGTAHAVLANLADIRVPAEPAPDYFTRDFLTQIDQRITDPEWVADTRFDYLIIDEAQDLLARPDLLERVMLFLDGGLETGCYCLFGDFRHQTLTDDALKLGTSLNAIRANATSYPLTTNCRNYENIGAFAARLSGQGNPYPGGYMRTQNDYTHFDIQYFETEEEQLRLLNIFLRDFKAMGFPPRDVSVLSFRSNENCAAEKLRQTGFQSLRPAGHTASRAHQTYASVHAFKGRENSAIILTDIHLADRNKDRTLFYTGITRATEHVRLLCHKQSKPIILKWLEQSETPTHG